MSESAATRYRSHATVDAEALEQLADVMEDEFPDLVRTYLSNVPRELSRLDEALVAADAARVVASAHAIKGSSANLGAVRLSALCRDLEHLARAGTVDAEARELAAEISGEFMRARPTFERRLASS